MGILPFRLAFHKDDIVSAEPMTHHPCVCDAFPGWGQAIAGFIRCSHVLLAVRLVGYDLR